MTTITVTQQVKELVFDIQNKAFLTGQAREAEGTKGYQAASNMQASSDEENSYQIKRSLENAFSLLKSQLGEYLTENTTMSDNTISQQIDNEGVLSLTFRMPGNYNNSSVDALGSGIHSYLVDMAIFDWFTITNKDDAAVYATHAGATLENVRRSLYKRKKPTRPTYTP